MKSSATPQTTAALFLFALLPGQPLAAIAPDHTLLLAQASPPAAADTGNADNASASSPSPSTHEDPRGRSARDVIGVEVTGANRVRLGQLDDLVIDAASGRILYGLVAPAGAARDLRVVPFDLLLPELADNELRLSLNTDEAAWERVPTLDKNQLDRLRGDSLLRQSIHRHFAQQPPPRPPRQDGQRLLLATAIAGKELRRGEDSIGKIESVIVNLPARRAAALVTPREGFVGTDAKFLLPLALLSSGDDSNHFNLTLTRQDFINAPASTDATWATSGEVRTPYLWPAYGTTATPLPGATASATASAPQPVRNPGPSASLPPVEEIRAALLSDPNTWSTQVRIVPARDRLILQGTVQTEDEKRRIENRVIQVAGAWPIDNQLRIAGEPAR